MDLIDGTRISPASARKLVQSYVTCRFSERVSQVASTGASLGEGDVEDERLSRRNFPIFWTDVPSSQHRWSEGCCHQPQRSGTWL